jgi:pimeloyl-ACP methyl ester carboxylesterase
MASHPLNVFVIHGIGDYQNVVGELDRDLAVSVRRSLGELSARYGLPDAPNAPLLNVIPGRWASVPEGLLRELEQRLFHGRLDRLRAFAMRFMGDVIAYQGLAVYEEIHRALAYTLRSRLKLESRHLTVIGHSLGSVIASDFLYDHTRRHGKKLRDHFGVDFVNFFTLGSPLVLYSARSPASTSGTFGPGRVVDSFDAPVHVESATGVWLNIYSVDDVVGYPLKCVNDAYAGAVTADVVTEAGNVFTRWNPLSHGAYWTEAAVLAMLADKLAIDYAECNLGLTGSTLQAAVTAYRNRFLPPEPPAPGPQVVRVQTAS